MRPLSPWPTSPIRAAGSPCARSSLSSAAAACGGAASRRPPEVWASCRRTESLAGIAASRTAQPRIRSVLALVPPETKPAAASSAAPGSSGTDAACSRAAAPLAASIRCRWPSRPNPVTSVAARTPAARAAWLAPALSSVIEATAALITSAGAAPCLSAVATTPVPIALVRISRSPGAARSMVISAAGSATPVTARPYLGTGSSIVCPPATKHPACAATSAPPRSTWPKMARSSPSPGQAARLTANSGRPPIAYTSDSAFAAAIRPQSAGSSTIGVKKSVVSTSARSSSRRSTAASSPSAAPMSRSPAAGAIAAPPMVANSASSLASGSLHAQPAPGDSEVSLGACVWAWVWSVVTFATVAARPGPPSRAARADADARAELAAWIAMYRRQRHAILRIGILLQIERIIQRHHVIQPRLPLRRRHRIRARPGRIIVPPGVRGNRSWRHAHHPFGILKSIELNSG